MPAPTVVAIFYNAVVVAVNEPDDVVLPVADIVVIRAVVVHGDHIAIRIVAEQQLVAARHLRAAHRQQHRQRLFLVRRQGKEHSP